MKMNKRGKIKILIVVVFLILLIGIVFVLAEPSANIKTYDPETKTVTIENNNIEIAKIKLNTPLVHKVIRGKDRLVAKFTINNFEDYSNVFNDMEFYDIKKNMKKFDREFNYKYKTFYDVEVIDYETICKENTLANGTIEEYDCYKNQTGTNLEERFNWNDFNEKLDLQKGNITIGIFTDILPNEKVEWIPTLFGVEIDEWAEWTESLSVGLISYWDLNESSGTTAYDRLGAYNGTNTNAVIDQVGKIGRAYDFQSNADINFGDVQEARGNEFTFSIWVWMDSCPNDGILGNYPSGATGRSFQFFCASAQWHYYVYNETAENYFQVPALIGAWKHLVGTYNETAQTLWENGTRVALDTTGIPTSLTAGTSDLLAGSYAGTQHFDGRIDEIAFWNRTLTDDEVANLWNDGVSDYIEIEGS